jgi:hypothetical protein
MVAALITSGLVVLAGCADGRLASQLPPTTSATARPAIIAMSAPAGAMDVDPAIPMQVTASGGTLVSVSMVNDAGKPVDGIVTPDRLLWKNTEPLGYGRTYTVTVSSRGSTGAPATYASTFTTVQPTNQTKVYLSTTGGQPLVDGATYGVGTVIVAHFDEPIEDRVAAQQHLLVTTSPPVTGSWHWVNNHDALSA